MYWTKKFFDSSLRFPGQIAAQLTEPATIGYDRWAIVDCSRHLTASRGQSL